LIALAAGHRLDEHDNPGEATVHVLHGTPSSATAVSTRLRGMVESRWVQQQLGRPVIKAFNNIYADHLRDNGRPAGTSGRIALPVAGDDESAKAVVMQLIDDLGFDAVDAGSLDQSWRQQPGTPVYTTDLDADGVRRALSEASPQRPPQWPTTPDSPGSFLDPR
jgi:predicted dinucleotide-binding enzyme